MSELHKLLALEKDARSYGFDWPHQISILDQVIDECREIKEDIMAQAGKHKIQEEIGDLLHASISLCTFSGYNLEETLKKVNDKFSRRMSIMKDLALKQGLKDFKGQSTEAMLTFWNEAKALEQAYLTPPSVANILLLKKDYIPLIVEAFNFIGWEKPASLFENYINETHTGERVIWVAFVEQTFAGYITLKWQSLYPYFTSQNIPEIIDLNVLPQFRNQGIGSDLLDIAEQEAAKKSNKVGIGVGLYAGEDGGYGAAQRLYMKRGYVPDGKGVTYHYETVTPGFTYPVDDELILWFIKKL